MRVFFVSLLLLSAAVVFVGCNNPSDNPSVKKAVSTPDPKGEGPKAVPAGLGITLTAGQPDAAQNIVLSWNTDKVSTSSGGGGGGMVCRNHQPQGFLQVGKTQQSGYIHRG